MNLKKSKWFSDIDTFIIVKNRVHILYLNTFVNKHVCQASSTRFRQNFISLTLSDNVCSLKTTLLSHKFAQRTNEP